jgi:hypothetical protein
VEVPDSPSLNLGEGDFTVEMWITAGGSEGGIAKYDRVTGVGFSLFVLGGSQTAYFYAAGAMAQADFIFTPETWHHIAGVKTGSEVTLYIDGALSGIDFLSENSSVSNDIPVLFGKDSYNEGFFNGSIDDAIIYSRALSEREILANYKGSIESTDGSVGLWYFEEETGLTADSSGQGNNGVLFGETQPVIRPPMLYRMTPEYNTAPFVKLESEISGTQHGILSIAYSVYDKDSGKGALKPQPISFFYCETESPECYEAAKDQPNDGKYNLDTTKIPDGDYRIEIFATDGYEISGNAFSGVFTIDNTGPAFDITVSPNSQIKETDTITVKIVSSEDLSALPDLKIIQNEANPFSVTDIKGSGREFEVRAKLLRGFPGKAVFSIIGNDIFGNSGDIITSGGAFLVEGYGPPPPTIKIPANGEIFIDPSVNVVGTTLPNIEVTLTVNGVSQFKTRSSKSGDFEFDKIQLSKNNKGYNTFSILGVNEKGEQSGETILKLKLNSPPKISILSSFKDAVSGETEIKWSDSDSNDDELHFSLEYSDDEGITWDMIASSLSENHYKLDSAQLADGSGYILRVTADDGEAKTSSITKKFTIKNNAPSISLDVPFDYSTNITTPKLTGSVTRSKNVIAYMEYSLDGGATWQRGKMRDDMFNPLRRLFEISVPDALPDGKYVIVIRVAENQGRVVKISRTLNIDTVLPTIEITDPASGKAVSAEQADISGKTEPKSEIKFVLGAKTYKADADNNGLFSIKGVVLKAHSLNDFYISVTDPAGNVSESKNIIVSDNQAQVAVSGIKEGDYIGGEKVITWQAEDIDKDVLNSEVAYRDESGEWIVLAKELQTVQGTDNAYKWDASKLENGDYKFKITVNDGLIDTEALFNVFVDNVLPRGTFGIEGSQVTNNAKPDFSGQASDDFSGIQYAEYSFDGDNWYKATIVNGYQESEANFEFQHRFALEDGKYDISVRVTDRAGNISYLEPKSLTIDTIPPQIGSNLITSGALIIFPDDNGQIKLFKNNDYKILLAVAGDAKEVNLKSKETVFNLTFNKATSLWESRFNFDTSGDYKLEVYTVDESGNSQTREISDLKVLPQGYVYNEKNNQRIEGAEVTLYSFDQESNSWLVWDGGAYDQSNPQKTSNEGEYGFLVPAGKYKLKVSAFGFQSVKSKEFEAKNNFLISVNIPMREKEGIFKIINNILKK